MNLKNIAGHSAKEILRFSIPAIIAMVLTSLITITDGYFTGNYIGKEGLTAINLGLPIVYLYLGLGLMISVGGSVLGGISLGAGKIKDCKNIFNQTMVTTTIVTILTSVVIFLFFTPLTNLLQAKGSVATYFRDYYLMMLAALTLMTLNNSFGMFIRGEGNPQIVMLINIINVVGNVILDYVFVSKLEMGIQGIALATLLCNLICFLTTILYFKGKAKIYRFGKFHFQPEVLKRTLLNGSSEFISEMSMVVTMFAYNLVLMKQIGVDGVTAFTIMGYMAYVFNMILLGFGQGSSPLISFSYGAKEHTLARKLRRVTNLFVFVLGIVAILVMLLCSDWYSRVFIQNKVVQDMVYSGIFIFIISFLFNGVNTISSFYFTSIGKAKESAIISSMRGLIVLLICICTLPAWLGMTGVWLIAPITEFITILFSFYYISKNDKKITVAITQ